MLQMRKSLIAVLVLAMLQSPLLACPFCSGVSQTFSEEMQTMDVAVICQLQKVGIYRPEADANPKGEIPKSTFVVTKVIKGKEYVGEGDTFQCVYFGEPKKERPFLAMATNAPKLQWSTPLILSNRAEEYLGLLKTLNATNDAIELAELTTRSKQLASETRLDGGQTQTTGTQRRAMNAAFKEKQLLDSQIKSLQTDLDVQRLAFFQDYLEDEDEMLARDAYDEFAKAPYEVVQKLKPAMDHDKLIGFLHDPDVPSNRRRLYFTMLGVCGTLSDAAMLEEFMSSGDRKKKAGLDALLACYLILTGEDGLQRVETEFLKNKDAEYADTYAAIMAIRFHGSEIDVIPRPRLTKALHHMLERRELADLVIPDLARWEDWSVIPKLVHLFATADEDSSWVRVPVVNYLRACPLPIAEEKIELLKTIDAEAVKRAMTFFPITKEKPSSPEKPAGKQADVESNSEDSIPSNATSQQQHTQGALGSSSLTTSPPMGDSVTVSLGLTDTSAAFAQVGSTESTESTMRSMAHARDPKSFVSIDPPDTLIQVESIAAQGPNFWKLLGLMMASVAACFFAMRTALGVHD